MTFDIQADVEPIGILPEPKYGVPLEGFLIDAPESPPADTITFAPDLAVYSASLGVTVDADYFKFLRIEIARQGPDPNTKHIIVDVIGINIFQIEPALAYPVAPGDIIYLVYCPIQHRVTRAPNELESGRSAEGGVGQGMYKDIPIETARMGKMTLESLSGSDFFKYGSGIYAYSSLAAYCLTKDGKVPNDGSGVVIPRDRPNASQIKSFSIAYKVTSGEIRLLKGCIVPQFTMSFDEDIQSHIGKTTEVLYSDLYRTMPQYTLPPDTPYKGYLLRSHGHCTSVFNHGTVLRVAVSGVSPVIYVGSVTGFANGDWIRMTSKLDGFEFETEIISIDYTNRYFNISPSLPLGRTWQEFDTIEQIAPAYAKIIKIRKLEFTFNNRGEVFGNICNGQGHPSEGIANASDYMGKIELDRESSHISFDMQYDANDLLFWRHKIILSYGIMSSDFAIEYLAFNTTSLSEEMKTDAERMKDAFGFQIKDITLLEIGKI